ncbi:MAG TPA: four helix bundle protein [Pirellulales bacterium]|nr:four helix bundle protein [Pirellulales bacterium]
MNNQRIVNRNGSPRKTIREHTDLEVYRRAFAAAMRIFELTKTFPREERYSLTDQVRRASRSVCTNLAEGWRKRRYRAAFIAKLNDSEGEASETQSWLQFSVECGYLKRDEAAGLYREYGDILGMLVRMVDNVDNWLIR